MRCANIARARKARSAAQRDYIPDELFEEMMDRMIHSLLLIVSERGLRSTLLAFLQRGARRGVILSRERVARAMRAIICRCL